MRFDTRSSCGDRGSYREVLARPGRLCARPTRDSIPTYNILFVATTIPALIRMLWRCKEHHVVGKGASRTVE